MGFARLAAAAAGLGCLAMPTVGGGILAAASTPVVVGYTASCPDDGTDGANCLAQQVTINGSAAASTTPAGILATDIEKAYKLGSGGFGQTVGIVDAFNDPNAESDMAVYRAQFGLPACTTANGCFRKVDENGGTNYPGNNKGWSQEISIDVDMVSAACPSCHILLVEAKTASNPDLGASVNTAVSLGATVVSNSYVDNEKKINESQYDSLYYDHPGVPLVAGTGDSGFGSKFDYPASSQFVTAVGGTNLTVGGSTRGYSESAWNGAGSGCSVKEPKPSWQKDTGCTTRTIADVSAVANNAAVYDSFKDVGWGEFQGTSVSTPIIAAAYALAGNGRSVGNASGIYSHTSSLFDVTSGSTGTCSPSYLCNAGVGYDGPTGWGTPNGAGAF